MFSCYKSAVTGTRRKCIWTKVAQWQDGGRSSISSYDGASSSSELCLPSHFHHILQKTQSFFFIRLLTVAGFACFHIFNLRLVIFWNRVHWVSGQQQGIKRNISKRFKLSSHLTSARSSLIISHFLLSLLEISFMKTTVVPFLWEEDFREHSEIVSLSMKEKLMLMLNLRNTEFGFRFYRWAARQPVVAFVFLFSF